MWINNSMEQKFRWYFNFFYLLGYNLSWSMKLLRLVHLEHRVLLWSATHLSRCTQSPKLQISIVCISFWFFGFFCFFAKIILQLEFITFFFNTGKASPCINWFDFLLFFSFLFSSFLCFLSFSLSLPSFPPFLPPSFPPSLSSLFS